MGKFVVLDHPLIQHKLTIIRRKDTGSNEFRRIVGEIGGLMTYEITRDLPLEDVEIETPMGGIKAVQEENPDVDIYAASEDDKLLDNGYIFPGLGDAGDRLFGTK